jgi:hypothetical protein
MLGCKIGYSKLPQDWLMYVFYMLFTFLFFFCFLFFVLYLIYAFRGLKEKDWLDEKVHRFLGLLGLND